MQGEHISGGLAPRREAIAGAANALSGLGGDLHQATGAELGPVLGEIDGS